MLTTKSLRDSIRIIRYNQSIVKKINSVSIFTVVFVLVSFGLFSAEYFFFNRQKDYILGVETPSQTNPQLPDTINPDQTEPGQQTPPTIAEQQPTQIIIYPTATPPPPPPTIFIPPTQLPQPTQQPLPTYQPQPTQIPLPTTIPSPQTPTLTPIILLPSPTPVIIADNPVNVIINDETKTTPIKSVIIKDSPVVIITPTPTPNYYNPPPAVVSTSTPPPPQSQPVIIVTDNAFPKKNPELLKVPFIVQSQTTSQPVQVVATDQIVLSNTGGQLDISLENSNGQQQVLLINSF